MGSDAVWWLQQSCHGCREVPDLFVHVPHVLRHLCFAVQGVRLVELGDLYFDVSLLLWCCSLVWLTQQGLCSAYVPMLMVAFPLATRLLLAKEFKHRGKRRPSSPFDPAPGPVAGPVCHPFPSSCRSVVKVQRAVSTGLGPALRPLHVPHMGRV